MLSLKRHVAGAGHEGGADAYAETKPSPPSRPATQQSGKPEGEGQATLPTERDVLRDFLNKLRFNRTDAVLTYCDQLGYGVRDVFISLKKVAASKDVIDATVSFWSLRRGEPIPPDIRNELREPTLTYASGYYDINEDDPRFRYLKDELAKAGYEVRRRGEAKHEEGLISILNTLLSKLVPEAPRSGSPGSDALVERLNKLEDENRELKRQLEVQSLVNPLKQDLEGLKAQISSLRQSTDAQTEFVRGIFDVLKQGLNIYQSVTERLIRLPEAPPRREQVGSAFSLVEKLEEAGGLVE